MRLHERAYLKLTRRIPARLAARLDLMRPAYAFAGPLNGQVQRQRLVRDIINAADVDEVIETGTFRGATTLFLNHASGKPVHSVELLDRYFRYAKSRCSGQPDIHLVRGDSRRFLRNLASTYGNHTSFFYLDAHWEEDVPRFEELQIISAGWKRALVVIDDFAVGDDPGYGFVRYGDVPLTLEYLPELPGWGRFYPAAPSARETGARRGCLVLASPPLISSVKHLTTLRPASG